jgi:hypothetical protein
MRDRNVVVSTRQDCFRRARKVMRRTSGRCAGFERYFFGRAG